MRSFKSIKFIFFIFFLFSFKTIHATVIITGVTTITSICGGDGSVTALPPIVFTEGSPDDFGTGYTSLQLKAPTGFTFVNDAISFSCVRNGDIDVWYFDYPQYSVTKTANTVSIYFYSYLSLGASPTGFDLDAITISGIKLKSEFTSSDYLRVDVFAYDEFGYFTTRGLASGTQLGYFPQRNGGVLFGVQNSYCTNQGLSQISFFPSTASGAGFVLNPSAPGAITYSTSGVALFDPSKYSGSTPVTITFTFPGLNGCTSVIRNTTINSPNNVDFFTENNQYSFPRDGNNRLVMLIGSVSGIGTTTGGAFTGAEGVSTRSFNADFTTGAMPQTINVAYTFTNSFGCTASRTKVFTVFDPNASFIFQKPDGNLPILQQLGMGTGRFCVDDDTLYSMSLNTLAGYLMPENVPVLGEFCKTSVSITSEDAPNASTGPNFGTGIVTTLSGYGSYKNFRFRPSEFLNSPISTFNLSWNYIYSFDPGCSPMTFSSPSLWTGSKAGKQKVTIYPKPSKPVFNGFDPSAQRYCNGKVVITTNINFTNISVAGIIYYYRYDGNTPVQILTLPGSNPSVSLGQLQIANGIYPTTVPGSITGIIRFAVRQKVDNCWSDTTSFFLEIKPLPTVPGISLSQSQFCSDRSYTIEVAPLITTAGYKYRWYRKLQTSLSDDSVYFIGTQFSEVINSTTAYYLTTQLNGCNSNEVYTIIGLPGVGNIVTITALFLPIPATPTIVGVNSNTTVAGGNKFCVGNPSSLLTVQIRDNNPVSFRWYSDLASTIPVTFSGSSDPSDSTGNTNLIGANLFRNNFDARINTVSATGLNTFYVKAVYTTTGCKSKDPAVVSYIVVDNPPAPVLVGTASDTLNGRPFCFGTGTGINISLTGFNSALSRYVYTFSGNIFTSTLTSFFSTVNDNSIGTRNFAIVQREDICNSPVKNVRIIVNPPVTPPVLNNASYYCTGFDVPPILTNITFSGGKISWFLSSVTSNPIVKDFFDPEIDASPGFRNDTALTYRYYVNYTDNFGCISSLVGFNLVLNKTPVSPSVSDRLGCTSDATPYVLNATVPSAPGGSSQFLVWSFNNITFSGSNSINSQTVTSSLNTSILGASFVRDTSFRYEIIQNVDGCFSRNSTLNLRIFRNPQPPVVTAPFTRICAGSSLPLLTARSLQSDSATFSWYYTGTSTGPAGAIVETRDTLSTSRLIPRQLTYPVWNANGDSLRHNIYVTQSLYRNTVLGFNGCISNPAEVGIDLYPLAPPPVTNTDIRYCSRNIIMPLTATGLNSQVSFKWYRSTVVGQNFLGNENPLNISVQNIVTVTSNNYYSVTQTYFYKNQNFACEGIPAVITVTVNPLPGVEIQNLNDFYCGSDNVAKNIIGKGNNNIAGDFSSTMPGFNNLGNGQATFTPSNVTPRTLPPYVINYTYTEPATGCTNATSATLKVFPTPTGLDFNIEGINSVTGFCALNQPRLLIEQVLIPNNLSYQGDFKLFTMPSLVPAQGILNNRDFNPYLSGEGNYRMTFTITLLGSNCVYSTNKDFSVHPIPQVDYSISGYCEKTPVNFLSSVTGVSLAGLSYKWNLGRGDSSVKDTVIRKFDVGSYTVKLTATTPFNCSSQKTNTFIIGPYPIPKFKWKNLCIGNTTQFIDLTDTSTIGKDKVKRIWSFGNPISIADSATARISNYKYNNVGIYNARLSIISDKNCRRDTTFNVNILPLIKDFPYYQNFDASNGNWFAEGINTDWVWGIASNKKYIANNNLRGNYWFTGTSSGFNQNEDAWVNSPCFEFDNLKRPMISLKIANHTLNEVNGAVLQYSINSGDTWVDLGNITYDINGTKLSSGINWYNSDNILGKPGRQGKKQGLFIGWSDSSSRGWRTAKQAINASAFSPGSQIRFRIAFGSNSAKVSGFDGFAFDSVWIGDRTKISVVEHFTNTDRKSDNEIIKASIFDLMASNQANVAAIQYHTSFPSEDPYNNFNPADPSARVLYYGVKNTPTTVFEGVQNRLSIDRATQSLYLTQRDIDLASLEYPPFDIKLNKVINGNAYTLNASISGNYSFPADTALVVHVALLERLDTLDGVVYDNILRRMLPSAAGTIIQRDWQKGTTENLTFSTDLNSFSNRAKLGTVVFVQNMLTKKIYQAAYDGFSYAYSSPLNIPNGISASDFIVYPNPATNHLYIRKSINIKEPVYLSLYSATGERILAKTLAGNFIEASVEIPDSVPSGIYLMKLVSEGKLLNYKIIIHK